MKAIHESKPPTEDHQQDDEQLDDWDAGAKSDSGDPPPSPAPITVRETSAPLTDDDSEAQPVHNKLTDQSEAPTAGPPSGAVSSAAGHVQKNRGKHSQRRRPGRTVNRGGQSSSELSDSESGGNVQDVRGSRHGEDAESREQLRSPILCIMGHVDTGKTKLLDKIRRTNVQDKEAGGITQQIGATFFPRENLLTQCYKVDAKLDLKVPGLLIIDTPGHASFNNLRKRGSSLCDIAILVVDIMHGVEEQTKESIGLLRQRKCPFIVALNKVDRLYGWSASEWTPIRKTLKNQKKYVIEEFKTRARKVLLDLTESQGMNFALYWENDNLRKTVSVVPTSAITGEGIPDLLTLIVKLTQGLMAKQIILNKRRVECTVLEVKVIEGLGTTIDVILVGGILRADDTIVVCGMNGPIVTTIRALLTPHPMKELRVKGEYIHHDKLYAATGVKIAANGLEEAVAGTALLVAQNPHDEDAMSILKDQVQEDMGSIFKSIDRTQEGVYVVASTLGSLEALLDFLRESKIPVSGISIGTVWKLDVKKASTMRERGREEYALILAFDVKIDPDAEKEAKLLGVTIFAADIIYHLFDSFTKHMEDFKEEQRRAKAGQVIYPCILKIIPDFIFNKKDPLIFGVRVEEGELHQSTPIVVGDKDLLKLGTVESIEYNKKSVSLAKKGQDVCIKISGEPNVTFGRHFDHTQKLVSKITRNSIDVMKVHFREDLETHKKLVVQLKKILNIP